MMQTTFEARPYAGDADLQGVCDLINTCNEVDQLLDEPYASLGDTRNWLNEPDVDKARDLRLWVDSTGRVVGLVRLGIAPEHEDEEEKVVDAAFYFRVHPETRNMGIEREMLNWASAQVRDIARQRNQPAHLRAGMHVTTPEYITYRQTLLEDFGFRPIRYGYKMARSLDLPIPEPQFPIGYTLRHATPDEDWERWVEAFNWSFIDHWNHHPLTVEQHANWLTSPKYRPEGNLMVFAPDGTLAAFCRCEIDDEGNANTHRSEGEIHVLGTRRGHRKIGLGRACLLAGLLWLKSQGIQTATLGVDAENPTGALRLYESVGFQVVNTTYSYHKDL